MAIKSDVVIYDDEFKMMNRYINNYCSGLINIIDTYEREMKIIVGGAIKDEKICAELTNIVNGVMAVRPILDEIKTRASRQCLDFLKDIDKADAYHL